jgi:hypothetical protein
MQIETPPGQAQAASNTLTLVLLRTSGHIKKEDFKTYINETDDTILWEITCTPRQYVALTRATSLFMAGTQNLWDNKLYQKMISSSVKSGDIAETDRERLHDLLTNQTKITIIKEADAQEIVASNKSFWERLKERFKKQ